MSNMSYCRFQNTYQDLADCQAALEEADGVENVIEDSSVDESQAVKDLIYLCREIADRYEDEV